MTVMPLSQAHLTLLERCDRKYQYVFFEALSGPATYDQQLTTQWGSQFHLLMQQQALNLPVDALSAANEEMSASMAALAEAAPEVFAHLRSPQADKTAASFSQSEHRRTLAFEGYLLTVIYDLLVCTPEQGRIFDWKTHQKPPKKDWLQNDWQTRLYLYVLCETTHLNPEQISMTYWFVRLEDPAIEAPQRKKPTSYRFSYSTEQHQKTERDLRSLTARLTQMIEQSEFPKIPLGSELCDSCVFNVRCDRPSATTPALDAARLLREASRVTPESVDPIPL